MIGIARESERIEPQSVHRGQPEQTQIRLGRGEMGNVEADEVMAQDECGPFGEVIQPSKRLRQTALPVHEGFAGISAHRGETVDARAPDTHLEVNRDATRSELLVFYFVPFCHSRRGRLP